MSKNKKECNLKLLIKIAQLHNGIEKEDAIENILNMFEPFRKSLAGKYANKGVEFEDICSQIDLKMIEAICDYDELKDSSAIRHITSKTKNGIWNFYRKEMDYFDPDRKTLSLDVRHYSGFNWEDILESDCPSENEIVERIFIDQELHKITEHQREVLKLYYISDRPQEEIAEMLNINQANVSRARKRGVNSLKININPLDEQHDKR